jgi:hypothetical protein
MKTKTPLLIAFSLIATAMTPALAQSINIPGIGNTSAMGSNQNVRIACNGKPQRVVGSNNVVRFSGYCPSVSVEGSDNDVIIDRAGRISTNGSSNRIYYKNLNPNPKAKGKFVHPGKGGMGSDNSISWTRGSEPDIGESE